MNVLSFSSHLVNLLGSHVVGSEPEDLGEVTEGPVHVVLVVEAQPSHVDGVRSVAMVLTAWWSPRVHPRRTADPRLRQQLAA